jgi:hypothetical protein
MQSGLQPVAISCNKSTYYGPFAALIDARAPFKNAPDASNALEKPILCKKVNVVELAFYEIHGGLSCGNRI